MALPVARPFAHSPTEVIATRLDGVPLLMPRYSLTYDIGLGGVGVDAFAPSLSRRAYLRRRQVQQSLGIAPAIAIGVGQKIGSVLFHGSSTPASNAATDAAANRARAGDPAGLAFVVQQGGFTSNGGWRGAVGKGADTYARQVLNQLINEGVAVGPLVDPNSWRYTLPDGRPSNNPNNWHLASPGGIGPSGPQAGPSTSAGPVQSTFAPLTMAAGVGSGSMGPLLLVGLGALALAAVVGGRK